MPSMDSYQRISDTLRHLWEDWRGEHAMPQEQDIDLDALHAVWEECFLVQITQEGGYGYDYMGPHLIDAYGEGLGGSPACMLLALGKHHTARYFDEVAQKKCIVEDADLFTNKQGLTIRYRQILLPIGTPEGVTTHILGAMRWRLY